MVMFTSKKLATSRFPVWTVVSFSTSDFLSNLLVLLIRILNSGISDSGLLAHLSEATAGSLNGVGHSTVYEELATYSWVVLVYLAYVVAAALFMINYRLAVKYLFLTDRGTLDNVTMKIETFNASHEQNDYEVWGVFPIQLFLNGHMTDPMGPARHYCGWACCLLLFPWILRIAWRIPGLAPQDIYFIW